MVKYLTFTKRSGAGSQTVTGVGFLGKGLFLWSTRQTADGATDGAVLSVGITDGIRQGCRHMAQGDNESTRSSAQAERTNRIVYQTAPTTGATPTVQNEATFTGFNDDGFVLNWLSADSAADIWHAVVFGGDDVQVRYTPVKITVGSGGNLAVSGIGFEPESFVLMGGAADDLGSGDYNNGAPFGSIHGFGFSNVAQNLCGWTIGFGNGTTAAAYRGQHTDRCVSIRIANASGNRDTDLCAIQIASTNDDGYVVTRTSGSLSNQPIQHILAIRGVRSALGSFNTPASPGTDPLTLGFAPDVLLLQAHNATTTAANGMSLAMGAWHQDGSGASWVGGTHAANPSVYARSHVTGKVLEARVEDATGSASAIAIDATVDSVDGTGASIAFATVPVTPVPVLYMAFGPSGAVIAECAGGGEIPVTADPPSGETFSGRVIEPRAWFTAGFDDEDRSFGFDTYNHRPDYYGGRKPGFLLSLGTIQRSLSYPSGSYRMGNASVELDDTSRTLSALEAGTTADKWWNREGRVYLASRATIEAGGTPHTLFRGVWRRYGSKSLENRSIGLTDLFGSEFSLFQLEQEIPKRIITATDFPDAPPDVLGRVVPIIYGRWVSRVRGGAVEMTLDGVPGGFYPYGVGLQGPEVGYVATVGGNGIELNTSVAANKRSWGVLPGTTPTNVVVSSGGAGTLPRTRNNTWTAMVTAIHDGVESDPAPVASIALGSDSAVNVSWTAASGGANGGYRIYLADNPYGVATKFSTHWTPFLVGSDNVYVFSVGSGTTSLSIAAPGTPYTFERIYLYQVTAEFLDGTESAPGGVVVGMAHPYNRPIHLRWRPFDDPDVVGYIVRRAPFVGVDQEPAFDRQFDVPVDGATGVQVIDGIDQLEWFDTYDDGEAAVVGETRPPLGGPIPVTYVGTRIIGGVSWGRLLVSGHANTHYEDAFIGGVPADAALYGHSLLVHGIGGSPSGDAYEDINGHRYACIYAKDEVLAGHLDGTAPITLSLCATEDVGNGSGRTITRAPRVIWHLLDQWGVQDYQTGNWSDPAESADGIEWINSQSFNALEAIEVLRLAAYRAAVGEPAQDSDAEGYELNLYIASPMTVRSLLEQILTPNTDIYFGQNPHGQLVGMHPPDSYDPGTAIHLKDVREIVDETPIDQRVEELEITRVYDYGFHPASGTYVNVDEAMRNSTAFSNNRSKDARGERVSLQGTQKVSQARDIARRAVTRNGRPPRVAKLTCTLHALAVPLGAVILVDDVDGVGVDGWTDRPLWVLSVSVRWSGIESEPLVELECIDAVWLTDDAPTLTLLKVPTPRKSGAPTGSSSSASWSGQIGEAGNGIIELTGDVEAGPGTGSQVATIAPSAVDYSKIQDVSAARRLLGRGESGGAVVREIDLGTNLEWDGDTINAVGGGASSYNSALASPPSSPSSGDLWLPSDAPLLSRYDASVSPAVWERHGPIFKCQDPTAAGLSTWVNQGTSAVASGNGLVKLTGQRSGSTATVAVRARVAGFSGNLTLTAGVFALVAPMANYSEGGILLRNSTSGRLETIGLNYAASGAAYVCQNYLSATAYIATPGSLTSPFAALTWFRITYTSSGATVVIQFSYDKFNWHTVFSGSSYTLGADQFGIYVNGQQNTMDPFISIVSLEF